MQKLFINNGEDFSGLCDAQSWCVENGYSFGSTQRDAPIGIMKGDYSIAKWRNLTSDDRNVIDGVITGYSKRRDDIVITIFDDEHKRVEYVG